MSHPSSVIHPPWVSGCRVDGTELEHLLLAGDTAEGYNGGGGGLEEKDLDMVTSGARGEQE